MSASRSALALATTADSGPMTALERHAIRRRLRCGSTSYVVHLSAPVVEAHIDRVRQGPAHVDRVTHTQEWVVITNVGVVTQAMDAILRVVVGGPGIMGFSTIAAAEALGDFEAGLELMRTQDVARLIMDTGEGHGVGPVGFHATRYFVADLIGAIKQFPATRIEVADYPDATA